MLDSLSILQVCLLVERQERFAVQYLGGPHISHCLHEKGGKQKVKQGGNESCMEGRKYFRKRKEKGRSEKERSREMWQKNGLEKVTVGEINKGGWKVLNYRMKRRKEEPIAMSSSAPS